MSNHLMGNASPRNAGGFRTHFVGDQACSPKHEKGINWNQKSFNCTKEKCYCPDEWHANDECHVTMCANSRWRCLFLKLKPIGRIWNHRSVVMDLDSLSMGISLGIRYRKNGKHACCCSSADPQMHQNRNGTKSNETSSAINETNLFMKL